MGAEVFGLYLQIMVDTGDSAMKEVSKGIAEDQSSVVGVLYAPGQHEIIRIYARLGYKSTQTQTLILTAVFKTACFSPYHLKLGFESMFLT